MAGLQKKNISQPPTCSYNLDWANLLCNTQPAPWVYWTAGGFALAGVAICNVPILLNWVAKTRSF